MRNLLAILIALHGIGIGSSARSQETCPEARAINEDCLIVPIEDAIEAAICVDHDLPACEKECAAKLNVKGKELAKCWRTAAVERTRADGFKELLLKSNTVEPTMWYEHPAFWGTVGLVSGVILGYVVATKE